MEDLKILVVDDESRMRKLVKDFLVKEGYLVVEAEGALQAVESPEVVVKAHLLFKGDMQPPDNLLV